MSFSKFIAVLFVFFSACICSKAQHYTTPFGQNRIQYQDFNWKYYTTDKFNVYYYKGGEDYALKAIEVLEDDYAEICDRIGYSPYSKINILIYNSIHDLQRSNVGLGGKFYASDGRTNFSKLNLEIAYSSISEDFEKELRYDISEVLIKDMMFGGSLADIFQSNFLLTLPTWFVEGISRYIAFGWDNEMDEMVRASIGDLKNNLNRVSAKDAGYFGQSFWNFIAIKFGERSISNILNLTRIIRKEEKSLESTLGYSFKSLLQEWKSFYQKQKEEVNKHYIAPDQNSRITNIKNNNILNKTSVSLSPSGDKLAFSTKRMGRFKIFIYDLKTKKTEKIIEKGFYAGDQKINFHLPLMAWQNDSTLAFIHPFKGLLYMNLIDINDKSRQERPLVGFRQINDISFNDDGKLALVSGDRNQKNDIFLISMRTLSIRRITNDSYDDLNPVFIPKTSTIIFSSNRLVDSLKIASKPVAGNQRYNLFLYDLDTTDQVLKRLTNHLGKNSNPLAKNQNEIYFLSDQQGVSNLSKIDLETNTIFQVTNFNKSIVDYDINFSSSSIAFSMLEKTLYQVYYTDEVALQRNKFSPKTPRSEFLTINRRFNQTKTLEKVIKSPQIISGEKLYDTEDYSFDDVSSPADTLIDVENYDFEGEDISQSGSADSFLSKVWKLGVDKEKKEGPYGYQSRFSFNNMISSIFWDPYRNLMLKMETEVADLFENYRFLVGLNSKFDFLQGDIYGEVQYLKRRLDFKFRFDRKVYLISSDASTLELEVQHKYILNNYKLTVAMPFTNIVRAELSLLQTNAAFFNLNYRGVTGVSTDLPKDVKENYIGGEIRLVVDNSEKIGYNEFKGIRSSLTYTNRLNLDDVKGNFGSLELDFRYYQPLHREIIWVNRFFYGKQMGEGKKKYILGGMDNWIFSQTNEIGNENPLAFTNEANNIDMLFNKFATNLRGYDYNVSNGTSGFVYNTEIHLPLFRYLSNKPIKSNFLRNFLIVGFLDLGSVWVGKSPLIERKSITLKDSNPLDAFEIEVIQFVNPILAGTGFGIRSVLLERFYLKFDWAKPFADGEFGKDKFYLTLGVDF